MANGSSAQTDKTGESLELPSLFKIHPDEDLIERYVMRQLSPADTELIETHLLTCERCRKSCIESEDHIRLMRKLLRDAE